MSQLEILRQGFDDNLSILSPNEMDNIVGGDTNCNEGYASNSNGVQCNCGYKSTNNDDKQTIQIDKSIVIIQQLP